MAKTRSAKKRPTSTALAYQAGNGGMLKRTSSVRTASRAEASWRSHADTNAPKSARCRRQLDDVAQDQHRPLRRRQVLEGGHNASSTFSRSR